MALVPLYDQNAPPGSSHKVRAPGGYETWRLWHYSPKMDVVSVIAVWNGYPHDRGYISAYRHYCRNPTQTTPPLPGDFAFQEFGRFGPGSGIGAGVVQRIEEVHAFPQIGPQGLRINANGSEVALKPVGSTALGLTTRTQSHHWDLANPFVQVMDGSSHESAGFCDYRYGDSPLNADYFLDGCVFFPSRLILFQATETTSWIVHLTTTATKLIEQPLDFHPRENPFWRRPTPRMIALGEHATLVNPQQVASEPSRLRVMYDAKSSGERGRAFCEINIPIRWPAFGSAALKPCAQPLTWSPIPPGDKSSPSGL